MAKISLTFLIVSLPTTTVGRNLSAQFQRETKLVGLEEIGRPPEHELFVRFCPGWPLPCHRAGVGRRGLRGAFAAAFWSVRSELPWASPIKYPLFRRPNLRRRVGSVCFLPGAFLPFKAVRWTP